jgi:hypothetical protein
MNTLGVSISIVPFLSASTIRPKVPEQNIYGLYCIAIHQRGISTFRNVWNEDRMARKGKRRGSTLNRSETVTVRLDPKLNYLCELAARSQRRTKSSLIEAAVVDALRWVRADPRRTDPPSESIAELSEALWHVDEVSRLCRLAAFAPNLMTYDEQRIWSVMSKSSFFWSGDWRELDLVTLYFHYDIDPQNLVLPRVEEHWDLIKRIAEGLASASDLPAGPTLAVKPSSQNPGPIGLSAPFGGDKVP